jgi:phage I-like protein
MAPRTAKAGVAVYVDYGHSTISVACTRIGAGTAECARRFEIDDQLEGRGLLDRRICGLRGLQHLIDHARGNAEDVVGIGGK